MSTSEHQRGYAKGYQAGKKRGYRFIDRLLDGAKQMRERAERAEAGLGIGLCAHCKFWTRRTDTTKWGRCSLPQRTSTDLPWIYVEPRSGTLDTSEAFGCIRFSLRK